MFYKQNVMWTTDFIYLQMKKNSKNWTAYGLKMFILFQLLGLQIFSIQYLIGKYDKNMLRWHYSTQPKVWPFFLILIFFLHFSQQLI